jgi:hypothetical protein
MIEEAISAANRTVLAWMNASGTSEVLDVQKIFSLIAICPGL